MVTRELLTSISSRSEMLSRRYYFLEKEDLLQEGYILLLDLEKKDLTNLQKHKAINNYFSNLERHAQHHQRIEQNSSSFLVDPDISHNDDSSEEILERNEITRALLDKLTQQEIVVVEWLSQGLTLNQIASILRVSRNRTRQLINHIINVRKEINNAM